MKISQKRQLDRFKRSLDFMDKQAKDFAPDSKALKSRDQLKDVIARAESNSSEMGATKPGRRVYHSDKLVALNALRAELSRVARTASLIEASDDSFKNSFVMPDKRRKDQLAKAATHFIEEFPKVSDKFKEFEMKSEDIDDLKSALEAYQQVQSAPVAKPARQPRTPTAPNPTIGEGIELVEALDIMLANKYNGNDEILDTWKEASTLEITRRRRKNKTIDTNA